ncbi:protein translocase subunit SecD [Oxobacter pfennigii]|uniref:Protein translocase subunit SecD n=1 Tax=Oxobacter pfennigii TaxID=36849 RepID=A0A0P8YCU1_9CLOT|nr:protein translocase subunit SecD [Oxobacter pfennigii]KPU44989.1 protein translocase subunit SecD [Oxobacter pfennigii]
MKHRSPVILLIIIAVVAFLSYTGAYGLKLGDYNVKALGGEVKQGLDLKGGIYVIEEIQDANVDAETVDRTVQLIKERVDKFGVVDPTIQKEGDRRIRIEIPGMYDQQKALEFIGQTGYLKFVGPNSDEILSGKDVKDAYVTFDEYNRAQISLEFNEEGKQKFSDATQKYIGQEISIYLDEDLLSAPTVQAHITDGNARITGMESTETAKRIASLIKSGALPVTLKPLTVRTIGPTLGTDALARSVQAAFVGILFVMIFMIAYYRLPGVIASIALVVYILINLYAYIALKATMSLSAIAGFLLSVGMAVDANVLIFERIKEELKLGKTLKAALNSGFDRALTSIIDGNVTTVIAAAILAALGTGPVKGFAVTLVIGIVASMLTAVIVTRFLLKLVMDIKAFSNKKLYGA